MTEIPARFGDFGLWYFCSSSFIAAIIGAVSAAAAAEEEMPEKR
jgi:hypothetical protein